MTGGVDDVDLNILVVDGGVFCKNGDAAFLFKVARVHDTLLCGLVFTVDAALAEHLVHKRGLAVVNVGDDRDVSQIVTNQSSLPLKIKYF